MKLHDEIDGYTIEMVKKTNTNKHDNLKVFMARGEYLYKGQLAVRFKVGLFSIETGKILDSYRVFDGRAKDELSLRARALSMYKRLLNRFCVGKKR